MRRWNETRQVGEVGKRYDLGNWIEGTLAENGLVKCVSTCGDTERRSTYEKPDDVKLEAIVVRSEAVDEPHSCMRLSVKCGSLAGEVVVAQERVPRQPLYTA